MKRFLLTLMLSLMAFSATAGTSRGSLGVSVTVLPRAEARVAAPAPTSSVQHAQTAQGDQWLIQSTGEEALSAYQAQLRQQGFVASADSDLQWRNPVTGQAVMISVRESEGALTMTQLTALAFTENAPQLMASR